MKKTIILRFVTIFCILAYLSIFALYLLTTGEFFPAWFSLACFFVGLWSLVKATFFHLDSNFWFGVCLIFVAFVGFLNAFTLLKHENLLAFYLLAPVYASVLTAVFFRNLVHYKISFALLLEDFLILLYTNKIISLLAFILCNIVLVVIIIGGIYVFKRKTRLQQKRSRQKD